MHYMINFGCRSILSMDNFCAKSEKLLFDYLVSWFSKWEEEESCTIEKHSREIFQLLYLDLVTSQLLSLYLTQRGAEFPWLYFFYS